MSDYRYSTPAASHTHPYLAPVVLTALATLPPPARLLELGCGNGFMAGFLAQRGYAITAIDTSASGIEIAKNSHPLCSFHLASAYDDLTHLGKFDAVVSLEVVEHLYYPRKFASAIYDLLVPGGVAIISTPYHSYLKNVALALSGRMDQHFTALWDHGHIKFWSERTLTALLTEAGFSNVHFMLVGRIPALAKSMVAISRKLP